MPCKWTPLKMMSWKNSGRSVWKSGQAEERLVPPRRTMSKAVRIALGWPAISSTRRRPGHGFLRDGSNVILWKDRVQNRLSSREQSAAVFISMAKIMCATARATAIENRPIWSASGDRALSSPAISPGHTLCTAFPKGSRIDAYSFRDSGIEFPDD